VRQEGGGAAFIYGCLRCIYAYNIYMCIWMYIYEYTYMYICIRIYIYIHMYIYMNKHICIYICTYMYIPEVSCGQSHQGATAACTHTQTHTYTQTNTINPYQND